MFQRLFDPENDFMIFLSQITDLIVLSFFWILSCLLVVTAGPGTAALYDAVFHGLRKQDLHSWERFLHSFRLNFKSGCLAAIPVVGGFLLGLDGVLRLFRGAYNGQISWAVFSAGLFLLFLLIGILSIVFPLLSRFETSLPRLFSNALRLGMAHLPRTLLLAALNCVIFYLCARFVVPLFLLPALGMLLGSFLIEPMLRPFLPEDFGSDSEPKEPDTL